MGTIAIPSCRRPGAAAAALLTGALLAPPSAPAQVLPPQLDPRALPSPAPAETPPPPRPPADARDTHRAPAPATAPPAVASPRPLSWTFAAGYTQGWDDNPFFAPEDAAFLDPAGASASAWNGRLSSALTRRLHGAHSDVVLDGRAEGWVLRDPSRRDRLTYALSGTGAFDLNPRLRATVDENWQTAYTDQVPGLALQGIVLQTVLAHTNLATAGLAYKASERTLLAADLLDERVSFSPPGALVGYSRDKGTLSVTRRVAPRDALNLSAALEDRRSLGRNGLGIVVGPGWEHGFGARLLARVSAGLQAFDALATGERHYEPYANGSLGGRFRRTLLTLTASHELAPGYEDGRDRIADLVVAAATRDLGRRFGVFVSGSAIRRRDLDAAGLRSVMLYTSSGLSWRLTRRLEARLAHTFERSHDQMADVGPTVVRRRQRADLFLGYRTDW